MTVNYYQVGNESIEALQINNDVDGNPRYVVHFLDLGLEDYVSVKGLAKYRGKDFGGGYVFQAFGSIDVIDTIKWMQDRVKAHNSL